MKHKTITISMMIKRYTPDPIVTCEDLQRLKAFAKEHSCALKFLDATFFLPADSNNPDANYKNERVPYALRFDVDKIAQPNTDLPHMLPNKALFEKSLSALGICNTDILICYGQTGMIMRPARAWWMLQGYGHENVYVLDGGLPRYKALTLPIETGEIAAQKPSHYKAEDFHTGAIITQTEIMALISGDPCPPILDARPNARFKGSVAEPRPHMRSGHIPKSISAPCSELVKSNGCIKPKSELIEYFSCKNMDIENITSDIITTCGSGITACAIALALEYIGFKNTRVYDGSWSEWGKEDNITPVEKSH